MTQAVADALKVSRSNAFGIVDAQQFHMQQSWGKGMDAQQTAAKILAAAQGE